MSDKPSPAGLLALARDALLGELLDALPEERRYAARLTANAIAIAAREAEADGADAQLELSMLAELYGDDVVERAGEQPDAQLAVVNRRFAADIRAGVFEGACARGVRALLKMQVCARLRISNPKYLAGWGLE